MARELPPVAWSCFEKLKGENDGLIAFMLGTALLLVPRLLVLGGIKAFSARPFAVTD